MNRRTLTLIELREIRNMLERAYDTLREMNCYSLPKAAAARQYLADSLQALKGEIDAGENHNESHLNTRFYFSSVLCYLDLQLYVTRKERFNGVSY